ncbi:hypothetical protein OSTOST_06374 [Ostertagia ostertagi]
MAHLLRLVICTILLTSTFVDIVHSSPQRRYCGKQITKALIALCGAVKSPLPDQLETGRRAAGDHSIVHECCRKTCDEAFMRRFLCSDVATAKFVLEDSLALIEIVEFDPYDWSMHINSCRYISIYVDAYQVDFSPFPLYTIPM